MADPLNILPNRLQRQLERLQEVPSFLRPWVRNLIGFYGAGDLVGISDFPHLTRAVDAFAARPAVVRGLAIPARA